MISRICLVSNCSVSSVHIPSSMDCMKVDLRAKTTTASSCGSNRPFGSGSAMTADIFSSLIPAAPPSITWVGVQKWHSLATAEV